MKHYNPPGPRSHGQRCEVQVRASPEIREIIFIST